MSLNLQDRVEIVMTKKKMKNFILVGFYSLTSEWFESEGELPESRW